MISCTIIVNRRPLCGTAFHHRINIYTDPRVLVVDCGQGLHLILCLSILFILSQPFSGPRCTSSDQNVSCLSPLEDPVAQPPEIQKNVSIIIIKPWICTYFCDPTLTKQACMCIHTESAPNISMWLGSSLCTLLWCMKVLTAAIISVLHNLTQEGQVHVLYEYPLVSMLYSLVPRPSE